MPAAEEQEAQAIVQLIWSGDVVDAEPRIRRLPASRVSSLLMAQAAFVRAVITGDEEAADMAAAALAECESTCARDASSSWREWAGSFVSRRGIDEGREEATAQQALCALMRAMMLGARQHRIAAMLAIRRSYRLFFSVSSRAEAAAPLRQLGVGFFTVLLLQLPKIVVRLLSVAGYGGHTEEEGFGMLETCASTDTARFDAGARYLSLMTLVALRMLKADLAHAPKKPQLPPSADGKPEATHAPAGSTPTEPTDADALGAVAKLQAALPSSLMADWQESLVLRRMGKLELALDKMRAMVSRVAASIETSVVAANGNGDEACAPACSDGGAVPKQWYAYRVRFQLAQMLFALRRYEEAERGLAPLAELSSRFTARAMANMHLAAALGALERPAEARTAMQNVKLVAERSGGKLDAQLTQRSQGWLRRDDASLGLCALELSYMMQYLKALSKDKAQLDALVAATAPMLRTTAKTAPSLEVRCTSRFLISVLAIYQEDVAGAEAGLRAMSKLASESSAEYAALPDRWHLPFAELELASVLMLQGKLTDAADALKRAEAVPQSAYSFHSWLSAAVRSARARLRKMRREQRGSGAEADGDADEEDGEEIKDGKESEEVAELREAIEKEEELD